MKTNLWGFARHSLLILLCLVAAIVLISALQHVMAADPPPPDHEVIINVLPGVSEAQNVSSGFGLIVETGTYLQIELEPKDQIDSSSPVNFPIGTLWLQVDKDTWDATGVEPNVPIWGVIECNLKAGDGEGGGAAPKRYASVSDIDADTDSDNDSTDRIRGPEAGNNQNEDHHEYPGALAPDTPTLLVIGVNDDHDEFLPVGANWWRDLDNNTVEVDKEGTNYGNLSTSVAKIVTAIRAEREGTFDVSIDQEFGTARLFEEDGSELDASRELERGHYEGDAGEKKAFVFYVEGIEDTTTPIDLVFKFTPAAMGENSAPPEDRIACLPVRIDIDVDSDNSGGDPAIDSNNDNDEDLKEAKPGELGMVIPVSPEDDGWEDAKPGIMRAMYSGVIDYMIGDLNPKITLKKLPDSTTDVRIWHKPEAGGAAPELIIDTSVNTSTSDDSANNDDTTFWEILGENVEELPFIISAKDVGVCYLGLELVLEVGSSEVRIALDVIRVTGGIDIDIDSDNDEGFAANFTRDEATDKIENEDDEPGKIIAVNDGDADKDGIPDYADGFARYNAPTGDNVGTVNDKFTPVVIEISEEINPTLATIKLEYDTSDPDEELAKLDSAPSEAGTPLPYDYEIPGDNGSWGTYRRMRLWTKDGSALRDRNTLADSGDYVKPDTYLAEDLLGQGETKRTFYIEGLSPSDANNGKTIRVILDPDGDDETNASVKDTVKVSIIKVNIAPQDILDQDEEARGAVVALNSDNDDFNPAGPHNYDPDKDQVDVTGEDDLKQVTLSADLAGLTDGVIRFEIAAGNDHIKVWKEANKKNLLLDSATPSHQISVSDFNSGQKTYYVEGLKTSDTPRDVELKLSYFLDGAATKLMADDPVKYTTCELILDVDKDNGVDNEVKDYKPGYNLAGTPVITNANGWRQEIQVIVLPVDLAQGETIALANSTKIELKDTTSIRGVAMNAGDQQLMDYSFEDSTNNTEKQLTTSHAVTKQVRQNLFAKDYGGKTRAVATIIRKKGISKTQEGTLAEIELRVPMDRDRDWLPDFYEDAHKNDPDGNVALDSENPIVAGAGVFDRFYDQDKRPETAGAHAGIDRNPGDGREGDGLTAFEEYRGFIYGDASNNNSRHHRLDPHAKDVFVANEVSDGAHDMELADLPGSVAGLNVHRVNHNQAVRPREFEYNSRIVNFNRPDMIGGEAPYPAGWSEPQRCLHFVIDNAIWPDVFGVAVGVAIETGANGICETEAHPDDRQQILLWQGEPNTDAILAGPNGIIDPPHAGDDTLDVAALRVNMGANNKLESLEPQGDDRIRGKITSATGKLHHDTVTAVDAGDVLQGQIKPAAVGGTLQHGTVTSMGACDDVLKGTIEEGADGKLEQGTVTSGMGTDDQTGLKITQGANGALDTPVHANDATDGAGDIVPGADGILQSAAALAADDVIRGSIGEGGDGVLNSRPTNANDEVKGHIEGGADNQLQSRPANANDVVEGTVEEGTDSNLKSRPQNAADYVDGYMDAGVNGYFEPKLNDDRATNPNPGFPGGRAADDVFDHTRMVIATGADGLSSTKVSAGAGGWDDTRDIPIGEGKPEMDCVLPGAGPHSRVDAVPNTFAAGGATRAGADDAYNGDGAPANGSNQSPNEHHRIKINVTFFQTFDRAVYGADGIALNADDGHADLRTVANGGAAANDGPRRSWIDKTMTHEGGHGMHCEHYRPLLDDVDVAGLYPWQAGYAAPPVLHAAGQVTYSHDKTRLFPQRNGAGAPANTDFMRSGIWDPVAPGGTFDAVTIDQIRLHLKHNP